MRYVNVAIFTNIDNILTYKIESKESNLIGRRVIVPIVNKYATGIIVEEIEESKITINNEKIREIKSIVDETVILNNSMIKLGLWISNYYLSAPGLVFATMLSPFSKSKLKKNIVLNTDKINGENLTEKEKILINFLMTCKGKKSDVKNIEKKISIKNITKIINELKEKNIINIETIIKVKDIKKDTQEVYKGIGVEKDIILNAEQQSALLKIQQAIDDDKYKGFLLMGITGSGKTEIYIKAAEYSVKKEKKTIILVPEIFLTPQILQRFKGVFKDRIAIYHSGLSEKQRLSEWQRIKNNEVDIAIGTRSCIFAPFEKIGLIIVDEEFDTSYKQENDPRYNARDVAVMRAYMNNGVVVLGSATPSIETYYNANINKYELLELKNRVNNKPLPDIITVDLRYEKNFSKNFIFSEEMIRQMNYTMEDNSQAILFINRRGFSNYVFCLNCGYVVKCINCDIPLVYHKNTGKMRCHYCSFEKDPVMICPECSKPILYKGIGTQRVEDIIKKFFSDKKVLRVDIDSMRDRKMYFEIYNKIKNREVDILVGTQMIAKGFDFPEMNFAGVVNIDNVLNLPDFRSEERVYQLLTQVAGRIGRGEKPGLVVIQTFRPDCMAIKYAAEYNTMEFYNKQIELRKRFRYPPFSRILQIITQDAKQEVSLQKIDKIKHIVDYVMKKNNFKNINILGPAPAPIFRLRNKYRHSMILKCNDDKEIKTIGTAVKKQKHGSDILVIVDPINTL